MPSFVIKPASRLFGPKTIEQYAAVIKGAKTVIWNGPMGIFEKPPFDAGSSETVRILSAQGNVAECFARLDACGADPELVADASRAGMVRLPIGGSPASQTLSADR